MVCCCMTRPFVGLLAVMINGHLWVLVGRDSHLVSNQRFLYSSLIFVELSLPTTAFTGTVLLDKSQTYTTTVISSVFCAYSLSINLSSPVSTAHSRLPRATDCPDSLLLGIFNTRSSTGFPFSSRHYEAASSKGKTVPMQYSQMLRNAYPVPC